MFGASKGTCSVGCFIILLSLVLVVVVVVVVVVVIEKGDLSVVVCLCAYVL